MSREPSAIDAVLHEDRVAWVALPGLQPMSARRRVWRAIRRAMSAMSAADSFGPGLRIAAEAITPRSASRCLRTARPMPLLLLVARQRQVGVEQVVRALDVAGGVGAAHADHHLGVGESGHRAVGAAQQFFGQEQATAVAGQDRHAAHLAALACGADRRQLGQARAVFVLEHHAGRRVLAGCAGSPRPTSARPWPPGGPAAPKARGAQRSPAPCRSRRRSGRRCAPWAAARPSRRKRRAPSRCR